MPLPIVAIESPELNAPLPSTGALDSGTAIIADYVANAMMETLEAKPDPWRGSPFAPLRPLKPLQKSKVARAMLVRWFQETGIVVTAKTIAGNATLILPDNQVAVVKLSMLWEEGLYRFQQVKDWDYQVALLFGLSPQRANLWIVPRDELLTRSVPQHGLDSRMLTVRPENPPVWLRQYGGTLAQASAIFKETMSEAA